MKQISHVQHILRESPCLSAPRIAQALGVSRQHVYEIVKRSNARIYSREELDEILRNVSASTLRRAIRKWEAAQRPEAPSGQPPAALNTES